jgi:hypothetical protein
MPTPSRKELAVARFKSVGANLFFTVFCLVWPVWLYQGSPLLGAVLAIFLWPLAIFFLGRIARLRIERDLLPSTVELPPAAKVRVPHTGNPRRDNARALGDWVAAIHPGWPPQTRSAFVDFMVERFGTERWDGGVDSRVFADGVKAYIRRSTAEKER